MSGFSAANLTRVLPPGGPVLQLEQFALELSLLSRSLRSRLRLGIRASNAGAVLTEGVHHHTDQGAILEEYLAQEAIALERQEYL